LPAFWLRKSERKREKEIEIERDRGENVENSWVFRGKRRRRIDIHKGADLIVWVILIFAFAFAIELLRLNAAGCPSVHQ